MRNNRLIWLVVFVLTLLTASARAQVSHVALPRVSAAAVPLYPHGAVRANIEGIVQVKVTTDGHRVVTATADKRSARLLAQAAEANARTWAFDIHEPTSF